MRRSVSWGFPMVLDGLNGEVHPGNLVKIPDRMSPYAYVESYGIETFLPGESVVGVDE